MVRRNSQVSTLSITLLEIINSKLPPKRSWTRLITGDSADEDFSATFRLSSKCRRLSSLVTVVLSFTTLLIFFCCCRCSLLSSFFCLREACLASPSLCTEASLRRAGSFKCITDIASLCEDRVFFLSSVS